MKKQFAFVLAASVALIVFESVSQAQTRRGVTPEDYFAFHFVGDPHRAKDVLHSDNDFRVPIALRRAVGTGAVSSRESQSHTHRRAKASRGKFELAALLVRSLPQRQFGGAAAGCAVVVEATDQAFADMIQLFRKVSAT